MSMVWTRPPSHSPCVIAWRELLINMWLEHALDFAVVTIQGSLQWPFLFHTRRRARSMPWGSHGTHCGEPQIVAHALVRAVFALLRTQVHGRIQAFKHV